MYNRNGSPNQVIGRGNIGNKAGNIGKEAENFAPPSAGTSIGEIRHTLNAIDEQRKALKDFAAEIIQLGKVAEPSDTPEEVAKPSDTPGEVAEPSDTPGDVDNLNVSGYEQVTSETGCKTRMIDPCGARNIFVDEFFMLDDGLTEVLQLLSSLGYNVTFTFKQPYSGLIGDLYTTTIKFWVPGSASDSDSDSGTDN